MKTTKIRVYGIKDQVPESSGCSCGPAVSMGDMYEEFVENMCQTDAIDQVDMQFIDIKENDLADHPQAKEAIENGYKLPLTTIDGRVRFQSSIPFSHVFSIVKRSLK